MEAAEQQARTRDELIADLAERDERIDSLERELRLLRDMIASLKDGLFGRKSERIEPGQLSLFGQDEDAEQATEPETIEVPSHKRKVKGHGRQAFPEHLPREVREFDLADEDKFCPDCGLALRYIGVDVCERGHFVPARMTVIREEKKKYGCPGGHCVRTPETPPTVLDRCKFEPSVYAHVVASKYQDHLPLHRLSGIFKRYGIHLPKQTMWDMLLRVDEVFARPLLEQMQKEILLEPVLHGDDTPVPVKVEGERGARNGRVWAWNTLGAKKAVYVFTMTKERDGPVNFLGEWSGTVILDGASNFDEAVRKNEVTRAGCWAHARRKLKVAMDRGSKDATRLLILVQRLFRLESRMKQRIETQGKGDDELRALRKDVRERRSRKLILTIYALAEEIALQRAVVPKSELGKALTYLSNQRDRLECFLNDERIPIHNNDCEGTLRHLVVGRNNWLIFGSPRGAEVACNLYSLMLSCRAAGVDPEAYVADGLSQVTADPTIDLASLTPWAWAASHPEALIENR